MHITGAVVAHFSDAEGISDAERTRRGIFARLVEKGYLPKRPTRTDMYGFTGAGKLPCVALPADKRFPLKTFVKSVNLP